MKTFFKLLVLLNLAFAFISCEKEDLMSDMIKYTEIDEAAIEKLNTEESLGLRKDATGVYYKKTKESPNGRVMNETYNVGIIYTLKTFDGDELLKATAADSILLNFYTSQSFSGFFSSLLLLKEGEKGIFYIPSALAYQNQPIPGLNAWQPVILELEVPRIYNENEQIDAYFERMNALPDTITEEGMRVSFLTKAPLGEAALGKTNVTVKYTGSLLSGSVFDSGNSDFPLGVGNVISGFEEAILLLRVGEKAQFVFSSELGYAEKGSGQSIPPYSPLKFEIELTAINN